MFADKADIGQTQTSTALADGPLVAVVTPLDETGTRWRASVRDARTLDVLAERDVDLDPRVGGSDEAFTWFLEASVERLGFHRGGPITHAWEAIAAATGDEAKPCTLDADPLRVYAWPTFRIPEHPRPAWADAARFTAEQWAAAYPGIEPDPLGVECSRDGDGSLLFDYEHKVAEVRGAAGRDVVEAWIMRHDRIERGVFTPGPVRLGVATASGEITLLDIDGDQPERLAALIRETALLARNLATGAAA